MFSAQNAGKDGVTNGEAFPFMRFVLPGMACITEIVIAILLFLPEKVNEPFGSLSCEQPLTIALGALVAMFVASGALGYLLANIYFGIYWLTVEWKWIGADHTLVFKSLVESGHCRIVDLYGQSVDPDELTKRDAWIIVTQYQHSCDGEHQEAQRYLDLLVSFFRGTGTTIAGTILSAIYCIWLICQYDPGRAFAAAVFWLVILMLLALSYRYSKDALERMTNSVVVHAIREGRQTENGENREAEPITFCLQRKSK